MTTIPELPTVLQAFVGRDGKLKHVQTWTTPTGLVRHFFRRRGSEKVNLGGDPRWGGEAFDRYMHAALASEGRKPVEHAKAGTIRALIDSYLAAHRVGDNRKRALSRLRDSNGGCDVSSLTLDKLQRQHVKLRDTPAAANEWRAAMIALINHAIDHDLLAKNPALKLTKAQGGGHHETWTNEQVAAYRATHKVGTMQRLAFELLVQCGFRQSDGIRVGHGDLTHRDGEHWFTFREQKTDNERNIPMPVELIEIMKATPGPDGVPVWDTVGKPWLSNSAGRPFVKQTFNAFFRKACDAAGLPASCVPHGLRHRCASDMADGGASERLLMAFFGWRDSKMALLYTRGANQQRLAAEAAKLKRRVA